MSDEYKININVQTDVVGQHIIRQTTTVQDMVLRRVINLEEAGIKQALIKLGWTPPPEVPVVVPPAPVRRDANNFQDRWICLVCGSGTKDVHREYCSNHEKFRRGK